MTDKQYNEVRTLLVNAARKYNLCQDLDEDVKRRSTAKLIGITDTLEALEIEVLLRFDNYGKYIVGVNVDNKVITL